MKSLRLMVIVVLGSGLTYLQFAAVAALNQSSVITEDTPKAPKSELTMVVSPPPEQPRTQPQVPPQARPTRLAAQNAIPTLTKASVLPALSTSNTQLGLATVLPNVEGVEFGHVPVPEVPSEPDRPARARRTVEPLYPISAQRDGVEGYVIVRLTIDSTGRVRDVLVVDSEPMGVFERSARDAARRFEFQPARVSGVDAATTLEQKIVFSLK